MQRLQVASNFYVEWATFFVFNVLLNHYLAFQSSHYLAIQNMFQHYNEVDKFFLLPNITSVSMTIE